MTNTIEIKGAVNKSSKVAEKLSILLADMYSLYLKTQNYHWNVTGSNFKNLHLLFEEQYNDLFAAIDEVAERIRALGSKAPATFTAYQKLTNIKEGNEKATAEQMVKELADDQEIIVNSLNAVLKAAQDAGDEPTIGIAGGRIGIHEKALWMLRSSI